MRIYSWFYNRESQVQIYEGNVGRQDMLPAYTLADAMKDQYIEHKHYKTVFKKRYKGLRGFFSNEYNRLQEVERVTYESLPPILYWIPSSYAEAFFYCIEEPVPLTDTCGVTFVDVTEFLEDK